MDIDTATIMKKLDSLPDQDIIDGIVTRIDGIEAKMTEPPPDPEPTTPDTEATLQKGGLDDLMNFKVWGIPAGSAIGGGAIAILGSELIDGFMTNQPDWQRGLAKLAGAGISVKWGRRLLGDTGSKAVALLLAFDAIRDLTPIDSWMDQLAEKISGTVTTGGLAGAQTSNRSTNVNKPATPRPAGGQSFYSQALGC